MSGLISHPTLRTLTLALTAGVPLVGLATNAPGAATTTTSYAVKVPQTFEYNTTGLIRTTAPAAARTVHGPNQLTFNGVSQGAYVTDSNQPIQLGQFTVRPTTNANGTAATTTYNHTPFVIQVRAPEFDKTSKIPVLSNVLPNFGRAFHLQTQTVNSLLVRGHLDGTVNGSTNSSVTATVDSVKLGSLTAPDKKYATSFTFPVRSTDLRLPTAWTMNTAGTALGTAAPAGTVASTATTTTPIVASVPAAQLMAPSSPTAGTVAAAQTLATPAAEMLTAGPPVTSTNLATILMKTPASAGASPAAESIAVTSTNLASPTPTPEPSTALILAAGAGTLVARRRRSR